MFFRSSLWSLIKENLKKVGIKKRIYFVYSLCLNTTLCRELWFAEFKNMCSKCKFLISCRFKYALSTIEPSGMYYFEYFFLLFIIAALRMAFASNSIC